MHFVERNLISSSPVAKADCLSNPGSCTDGKTLSPLLVRQQRSFVVQAGDAVELDLPDLQTVGPPDRSGSGQLFIGHSCEM